MRLESKTGNMRGKKEILHLLLKLLKIIRDAFILPSLSFELPVYALGPGNTTQN
jgi:hypothetical protein